MNNIEDLVKHFEQRINDKIEEVSLTIASGHARSFDQYRELVGSIRGLRQSLITLKDILK